MELTSRTSSRIFPAILIIMMTSHHVTSSPPSSSPCHYNGVSYVNPGNCLVAIRQASEDKNRFWFGDKFANACRNQSKFSSECYNPSPGRGDSLVSRIFKRKAYDRSKLRSLLKVTYKTHTGSYMACGNAYETYKSRKVHINDPFSSNVRQALSPFEMISRPEVTWDRHWISQSSSNATRYALAIVDAGYLALNALYINIPSISLEGGQAIVDYTPPVNPTRNDNPYVFLLFVQKETLELSPQWLHSLSLRSMEKFDDFLIQYGIEGPVGLTWITARADPYSADNAQKAPGNMNTCAQFVDEAFKRKDLPFLPRNAPSLNVYLDITFNSPAIVFSCCCGTYSYQASVYKPNPIGDGEAKAVLMRREGQRRFVFRKSTAFPLQPRDFKDELHTLLMVDPDVPFSKYGSRQRPYAHMVVSNIQDGNFESGQVVLPYSGPWPPDPDHHTYYFLLFKQQKRFRPRFEDYAFMNCTGVFKGRCGFNMAAMIREGGLELVGASWQLIKSTDYVRCVMVNLGSNEKEICADVDGYSPTCANKVRGQSGDDNNAGSPYFSLTSASYVTHALITICVHVAVSIHFME